MKIDSTQEANPILAHTPNGVVLVDQQALIRFVNPAFRRMFAAPEGDLSGRKVADLIGSDCFERAIACGGEISVRGKAPKGKVFYRATLFPIEGEPRWCGIFVDISDEERARKELQKVREETLARAEQVIHRQMQAAQEIAGLLGETTAETKALLAKLMDLFRQEERP